MTEVVPTGGEIEVFSADSMEDLGLGDVTQSDVAIPRLKILHAEGMFEDSLSKQKYPKMQVILLGLVKQRIMFHPVVDEGDKPQCKSPDFEHGFPNMDDEIKKEKRFPWADSNFDPSMALPLTVANDGYDSNGLPALPCASCAFKDWGADKSAPRCSEQHTFPLLYAADDGILTPALLTVQKTGIKPSKNYISTFVQRKTPMFTVYTEISLETFTRGTVTYSVPKFRQLGPTERAEWADYSDRQKGIRAFVRQAPRNRNESEDAPVAASSNENVAPTPSPPAPAPTPTPAPAPAPAPAAPAPPAAPQPPAEPAAPVAPVAAPAAIEEDLPF